MQSEEEDWNTDSTQSESELQFDDADRPNTLPVVDRLKINVALCFVQLFVQLIVTCFLSSTECVSTLLDLSFYFPFPRYPFAVKLRAPDFSHYQSGQSAIRYKLLVANDAALNAFSRKFKTVLSQTLFREP